MFRSLRKTVEQAGFKPTKSIVLSRDTTIEKKGFAEEVGKGMKGLMEHISDDEIKQARELIVGAVLE